MYLGFWGLDLESSQKKQMIKKGEKTKKEETIHCLQGANPVLPQGEGPPRGNSRDFFLGVLQRDGKSNERRRKKTRKNKKIVRKTCI